MNKAVLYETHVRNFGCRWFILKKKKKKKKKMEKITVWPISIHTASDVF